MGETTAYVVVRSKGGGELVRRVLEGPTIFGRASECEVSLSDVRLSRLHCRIEPDRDHWVLIDLNSRNGTLVTGEKIERYSLSDGDEFEIASSRVTFHLGSMPRARPK